MLVLLMLFLPEFGVITLSVGSEVSDCLSKPDGNGNSDKGSKPDNKRGKATEVPFFLLKGI